MQQQPKYTPLDRSWFYSDGRAARPIPAGAVSIDDLNQDPDIATGAVNGAFLTTIPVTVTSELLARGRDRFDIYCSPCHGRVGDGNGMIARRGFRRPADLNSPRVRNAPPGYLFQVISKGYGAMSDYSYQIKSYRDRWAIVAYIRALELSRQATVADVPPQDQPKLEAAQ
jgi:mono/diheme cytochrome c family protein